MGIEEINKTLSNYVIWCEEQNQYIPEDVKKAILALMSGLTNYWRLSMAWMGKIPVGFMVLESYQTFIKLEYESVLQAAKNLQALRRSTNEIG